MNNKNKKIGRLGSIFIIIVFLLVGFFLINLSSKNLTPNIKLENIKYVKIAGQNIKVDLALTPAEKNKGLSGRNELKAEEGMLFVFDQPDKYYFWMKEMNFPIDIIWIAEDMRVVYIKKNAQPEAFPETFGPDVNTKYVLEVVAGFSDKNNLKAGDSVLFTY